MLTQSERNRRQRITLFGFQGSAGPGYRPTKPIEIDVTEEEQKTISNF